MAMQQTETVEKKMDVMSKSGKENPSQPARSDEVVAVAGDVEASPANIKMQGKDVSVHYGDKQALFDVNLDIPEHQVMALIGPSGCGKSTFLRCLNRMNDTISICRVNGDIRLDGVDIYDPSIDVVELRARVGMVFQKPNPFPKSIFENVAYGPRIHGLAGSKKEIEEVVVTSLEKAGLFDEVKDRLQVRCHCIYTASGIPLHNISWHYKSTLPVVIVEESK